jgi:hypothetical protein
VGLSAFDRSSATVDLEASTADAISRMVSPASRRYGNPRAARLGAHAAAAIPRTRAPVA